MVPSSEKLPWLKTRRNSVPSGTKPLNGISRKAVSVEKEPKIAFTDVADEHGAIRVHDCDEGVAVEYVSPFVRGACQCISR